MFASQFGGEPDDVVSGTERHGRFRRIFGAQVRRDAYMARVAEAALLEELPAGQRQRGCLVLCGSGHVDYGLGVPERVRGCGTSRLLISSRARGDTKLERAFNSSVALADLVFEYPEDESPQGA